MSLKEKLEAIWNKPGVSEVANVCIWYGEEGNLGHSPGERRDPPVGKSAEAFMRRVRKHWGPAPMAYCGTAKLVVPDWLRENYKSNCPNNYKTLIAEYGCSVSKLDRALDVKNTSLFGGEHAD
jgi:GH25 family lysozyme M1 (1,4-beta-N-acetylmuramidase)